MLEWELHLQLKTAFSEICQDLDCLVEGWLRGHEADQVSSCIILHLELADSHELGEAILGLEEGLLDISLHHVALVDVSRSFQSFKEAENDLVLVDFVLLAELVLEQASPQGPLQALGILEEGRREGLLESLSEGSLGAVWH